MIKTMYKCSVCGLLHHNESFVLNCCSTHQKKEPPTSFLFQISNGTRMTDSAFHKTEKMLFSLMTMCNSDIDDATFRKIAKESFKIINKSYTWA